MKKNRNELVRECLCDVSDRLEVDIDFLSDRIHKLEKLTVVLCQTPLNKSDRRMLMDILEEKIDVLSAELDDLQYRVSMYDDFCSEIEV